MATDTNAEDVEVKIRRSSRKRRSDWKETLSLSVRASRAKAGDSTIPVRTRGGQPSHKKRHKKIAQVRTI